MPSADNRKLIIGLVVLVVLVGLVVAGYFYFKKPKVQPLPSPAAQEPVSTTTAAITENLVSNPLEKKPDLNPVNKANPFKDVKTNPFE